MAALAGLTDEEVMQDAAIRQAATDAGATITDDNELRLAQTQAAIEHSAGLAGGSIEGFQIFIVDAGSVWLQMYVHEAEHEPPVYDQAIKYDVVGDRLEATKVGHQMIATNLQQPAIPDIPIATLAGQLARIKNYLEELSALPVAEIRSRLGLAA